MLFYEIYGNNTSIVLSGDTCVYYNNYCKQTLPEYVLICEACDINIGDLVYIEYIDNQPNCSNHKLYKINICGINPEIPDCSL